MSDGNELEEHEIKTQEIVNDILGYTYTAMNKAGDFPQQQLVMMGVITKLLDAFTANLRLDVWKSLL